MQVTSSTVNHIFTSIHLDLVHLALPRKQWIIFHFIGIKYIFHFKDVQLLCHTWVNHGKIFCCKSTLTVNRTDQNKNHDGRFLLAKKVHDISLASGLKMNGLTFIAFLLSPSTVKRQSISPPCRCLYSSPLCYHAIYHHTTTFKANMKHL